MGRYFRAMLFAALIGAGPSAGFAASVPTLPRGASEASIEAWIQSHLDAKDMVIGIQDEEMVDLYDPGKIEKTPDGHLLVTFRNEYFVEDAEDYRSALQRTELDCELIRFRTLSATTYSQNNLKGKATVIKEPEDWTEPLTSETYNGAEVLQVCSFASLIDSPDRARATPPALADHSEASVQAWRARYIDLKGYAPLISPIGTLPIYYEPSSLKRVSPTTITARLRNEFTRPIGFSLSGMRSTQEDIEIDCAHARYRHTTLKVFPGSNLLGAPFDAFEDDRRWRQTQAGETMTSIVRGLCRLAADPKLTVDVAVAQPPIPAPASTEIEDVATWARANLNSNGHVIVGSDGEGVNLLNFVSLQSTGDQQIEASIRRELFQTADGPFPYRALSARYGFDCRQSRYRALDAVYYGQSNLEGGALARTPAEDHWGKVKPGSNLARWLSAACSHQSLLDPDIDPDLAFLPPPVDGEDESVEAWAADYIVDEGYALVAHSPNAAHFVSEAEIEQTKDGVVRAWTRTEFFEAADDEGKIYRSSRRLMDFDCNEGRTRVLATELYPGSNLLGEAAANKPQDAEWAFIEPQSAESIMSEFACRADDAVDSQISEPRLPPAREKTPL